MSKNINHKLSFSCIIRRGIIVAGLFHCVSAWVLSHSSEAIMCKHIPYRAIAFLLCFFGSTHADDLQQAAHGVPQIEIVKAVFGSGRSAVNCTERIQIILQDQAALTTINTPGMGLKNPRGLYRDKLVIHYRVEGREGTLTLNNDDRVNLHEAILNSVKAASASEPVNRSEMVAPLRPAKSLAKPVEHAKTPATARASEKQSAGPVAVRNFAEATTVELPEPLSAFHLGGGGRYIICQLPKAKLLAVVDLTMGRIVKQLPLPSDDARFVAGNDLLLIIQPAQGLVQSYSLHNFERQNIGKLSAEPIKHLRMGYASSGPLWVWSPGKEIYAMDTETLKPIVLRGVKRTGQERHDYDIRVSPDGKTLTTWHGGIGPAGFELSRLVGNTLVDAGSEGGYSHNGRYFQPNADGSLMLCHVAKGFVLSGNLKPRQCDLVEDAFPIVTADPRYFLGVKSFDERQIKGGNAPTPTIRVQVFAASNLQPIYTMKDVELNLRAKEPSVVFLPQQKLLAVIPETPDRVIIRALDLSELAAGGEGELAVISVPPTTATLGANFTYDIEAIPATGLTYKLETGPKKMKVSPQGKVTWSVPVKSQLKSESVIISVRDTKKNEVLHAFDLALVSATADASGKLPPHQKPIPGTRPRATDDPVATRDAGKFATVGDDRLELPDGEIRLTPGLDKTWLLLVGSQLAIIGGDGVTLEKTLQLPNAYTAIAQREEYYVAINSKPMSIDIIDKQSLKVIRSRKLPYQEMCDIQLHPTLPLSYVSFKATGKIPRYRFVVFNERTTEADESEEFLGTWLRIDPQGEFLVSGYKDIYQRGHDIIANPDRWHVVPNYGNIDWLIRYKLDATGMPTVEDLKVDAGGNGHGIRLSPDGQRITYLSYTGTPLYSGNLAGWNTGDFKKLPVAYGLKNKASAIDLDFHPILPLVLAPAQGGAIIFHRESGDSDDRISPVSDALTDIKPSRAWFSPDGKHAVVLIKINEVNHLYKLPLKLSKEEQAIIQKVPEPRLPPPAKKDPTQREV
jgi:hypothetical protein